MTMKLGERGQVTIPKEVRDFMGLGQDAEVDFQIVNDSVILKKAPKKLDLGKWRGYCKTSLADLKYESVDAFIDDVRPR